jgi:type VI protein secretion system component Hcp
MRHVTSALFAVALFASAPAHAAMDLFLCIASPYTGETQDSGFPNCIDVISVSDAAFTEGTSPEVRDLRLTKFLDASSTVLRRAFVQRSVIQDATLYVRSAGTSGGASAATHSIKLFDLMVTSMSSNFSGGEDRVTETISLRAISRIEYMYRREVQVGPPPAPTYVCWNVVGNTATNARCN